MKTVSFKTDAPYDHVSRALDHLRRMGVELHGLTVAADGSGYMVRIEYCDPDKFSSHTLLARLMQTTELQLSAPVLES